MLQRNILRMWNNCFTLLSNFPCEEIVIQILQFCMLFCTSYLLLAQMETYTKIGKNQNIVVNTKESSKWKICDDNIMFLAIIAYNLLIIHLYFFSKVLPAVCDWASLVFVIFNTLLVGSIDSVPAVVDMVFDFFILSSAQLTVTMWYVVRAIKWRFLRRNFPRIFICLCFNLT